MNLQLEIKHFLKSHKEELLDIGKQGALSWIKTVFIPATETEEEQGELLKFSKEELGKMFTES